ncbi:MAG: DUF262 domain-containing protein [Chitinophagaceae bacterium]|nr:DUF262 domain-containing protein [Chitinophagaceae bacterium]
MEVKPDYGPVGKFFEFQPVYRVPPYQRAYAWEKIEIEDFVKDLHACYDKRKFSEPVVHFFGQIVCIKGELPGTDQLKYYELVDGQQRIATFVLLVAALINVYKEIIATELEGNMNLNNERGILQGRIQQLTKRYFAFQLEIDESFQDINVLVLCNRDRTFFQSFLKDINTVTERESHKLIKEAYALINNKVKSLIGVGSLKDRIGNLKDIEKILEQDFCILNMVTDDRKAAFKLFQVLNNRGKNLTEGDLLRAECLRMLEPHQNEQEITEKAWDHILLDKPTDTEEFLRAIYSSYTGQKAGTNSLFNDFLLKFLPESEHEQIDNVAASRIKDEVIKIEEDVILLRKISSGQWPYESRLPVEHWDRNKLPLLVHALGHKECLPLLLSARELAQPLFSDIVNLLERFAFRYLIIGNQYVGDLIDLYNEEARAIRDNPGAYTIDRLKLKLQPLMDRVDEAMFRRQLDDFKYTRQGKSNKPLKYFLLSAAYYYPWYIAGANGYPTYTEKQIVYDFTDSTIEHVYPYNGVGAIVHATLEPLKNTLGNLTILGNLDNRTGANDDFATKRPIYEKSSLMINRDVRYSPNPAHHGH